MITQDELKRLFTYDEVSGKFTRNITINSRALKGQTAGSLCAKSGYIIIVINKKSYLAHRLVFLYKLGIFPKWVDHTDTNKANNSWANLRQCSPSENRRNSKILKHTSTSIKGISFTADPPHYRAGVKGDEARLRKCFSVAKYGSKEKALDAAVTWVRTTRETLHKQFTNHG